MELQKLYVSLMLEMKQYAAGLDDAVGQARSFGDRIKGALGGAVMTAGLAVGAGLAAVGGGVVALGASSVGVATEFQSSMAIMSTAVDPVSLGVESTAEAMGILSDASLAVGSDTALVGVSASTSAEAMTGLYKAGLSTGEIFGDLQGYLAGTAELGGALRASIDLAAASELDMVAASDLAAVTLATFGGHLETEAERAEFINSAMNNFVQTADASVASVGDLQAAFVNVGPAMAQFGVPMEDVNTALAILSTRGIAGAEAGTNLKSMMMSLMSGTEPVTEAMAELGISLYDLEGNMYTLPQIMSQVEQSLVGLTEEQQNHYIKTLAGNYGISSMTALLGEGSQGWIDMQAAIGGAATMQETAAARTNTLAGAQEALSGVWESFRIQVGTALIPVLTMLANLGAMLLERYGPTLVAVFENIGAGIGRIMEVVSGGRLGELFTVFEDGSSTLGYIFEAFGMGEEKANALATSIINVVTPVRDLGDKLVEFATPIITAVTNFVSLRDILIVLAGLLAGVVISAIVSVVTAMAPIILIVGGVIAVVALLRNAWEQNWGGIEEKVIQVGAALVPIFQTIVGTIQSFIANMKEGMSPLNSFIEAIWDIAPKPVLDALINLRDNVLPALSATFQTVWGLIKTVIGAAVETIRPAIETIVTTVQGAGTKLQELTGPLQDLWTKIGPFIQAAATVIGGILVALVGVIVGIVTGIAKALDPLIRTFVNVAENIIQIVGGIIEFFTGFFNLLIGMVTDDGDKVKEAFGQMGNGIKDIVTGLVEGVWNLFSGLVETVATLIDGFITGIIDFFKNLYDELVGHSIVVDLINDIVEWFENLITWIGDALLELWDAVSQPFIDMWANLTAWFAEKVLEAIEFGRNIILGIVEGLQALGHMITQTIMSFMNAAWDAISSFWETDSPSQLMVGLGVNIAQGLIDGLLLMKGDVADAFDEAFNPFTAGVNGLIGFADAVGGIAGGFARQFERTVTGPMAARLDELTGIIEGHMPLMRDVLAGTFGQEMADWNDPAMLDTVMAQLRLIMGQTTPGSLFHQQVAETRRALLERNALEDEYIRQQEKLLALEQARADLDFLKSQMELLKLISDNNLPAELLAGVQLGLAGDPGQLMAIMVTAMEALVRQTSQELNLASQPALNRLTPGAAAGATYNVQNQTINGGQNFYIYDTEESELERLGVLSR